MTNTGRTILKVFGAVLLIGLPLVVQASGFENDTGKIIVNVTEARVRNAPSPSGKVIGASRLGTVYSPITKRGDWYNIQFTQGTAGWISATIVEPFSEAQRNAIYRKLSRKYLDRPKIDFDTASELFDFLDSIGPDVLGTELEALVSFDRLLALNAALEAIPFDKIDKVPYLTFTDKNQNDVAYSEPAGQYMVIADRYWDLREQYASQPIAEKIAWKGAETILPGECEGYVICHLSNLRETYGKYLQYYPNGPKSGEAIKIIEEYLKGIAEGAAGNPESGYYISDDSEDRTQLENLADELFEIVSRTTNPLKKRIIEHLEAIRSGYQTESEKIEPSLGTFWSAFRAAVIRKDRIAVTEMTKFPFSMPFGRQSIKNRAEFLRNYDVIFSGETNAARCFESAVLSAQGVYCGFKNALDSDDKPIRFYFEETEQGWKFAGLDNINE